MPAWPQQHPQTLLETLEEPQLQLPAPTSPLPPAPLLATLCLQRKNHELFSFWLLLTRKVALYPVLENQHCSHTPSPWTGHKLESLLLCPVASGAGLERGGQEGLESRGPAFPLSDCVTERGVLGSLGLSFYHQENELMRPASWVSSEAWVHGGHGPCGLLRQRQAARLAADLTLKGSASSDGQNSPQDPAGLWGAFGLYWIFTYYIFT